MGQPPRRRDLKSAEPHFLMNEAARFRRIAREIADAAASRALRELAEEYEAEARSRQLPEGDS